MGAGGMTDPPALAFATSMARCDSPAVSYAAVYPLTMHLRIIVAQVLSQWAENITSLVARGLT